MSDADKLKIAETERDLYLKAWTLLLRRLRVNDVFCCGYCEKATR